MDKRLLQQMVLDRLAADLQHTEHAARTAHEAATHEENIAENKYDTLGLEASYLATGQARRAEAIGQALKAWRQFQLRPYAEAHGIQLGALVGLADADGQEQQVFLGPAGGSMTLTFDGRSIQVISIDAPLGRAMLGKAEGDEVSFQVAGSRRVWEVVWVR